MHHVTKVEIEGFWETHDLTLNLFPEVTFLIGQNGTGKTTLINLIAAALTADFRTLEKIPFRKIIITLDRRSMATAPVITINKPARKDQPYVRIEYRIRPGDKSAETKIALDESEESFILRHRMAESRLFRDVSPTISPELVSKLRVLVAVNWLSVNRAPSLDRPRDDRSFESAVDQRLEAISNELVRYFATLGRRKDEEVRIFQETMFFALIEQPETNKLLDLTPILDLEMSIQSLSNIFTELHMSKQNADRLLDYIHKTGETVRSRFSTPSKAEPSLHLDDAVFLLSLRRISAIIGNWSTLQNRLSEIFATRDRWLRLTNELLQRKKMELSESNELQFISRSGKLLKTNMLSSGEKQLLILLSETLLQREKPSIFIADEPELSLHVLWQERIVSSLRELNPSGQIIAATHSPDIVGALRDRTIDMESLIP